MVGPAKSDLALPGLSLFIFVGLTLGGGFICVARYLLPILGIDLDQLAGGLGLLCILVAVIVLGVMLIYGAVVAWLFFAKLFFTRSQVEGVANWGPTSRFDWWLINTFFPK